MSIDGITDAPRDHASQRRRVRRGNAVFVSHTSEMAAWPDGRSSVDAALDAIRASGLVAVDMRDFSPADLTPMELCERQVLAAQVYVGLIGFEYGSRVPGTRTSYTETEFDIATEAGLPRVVLLRRAATGAVMHPDQERFRRRLTDDSGLTVAFFDDVGDLFRGRDEALAVIIGWLEAQTAPGRVLVVTGQPGAPPAGGWWRLVVDALDEAATDIDRDRVAGHTTRLT